MIKSTFLKNTLYLKENNTNIKDFSNLFLEILSRCPSGYLNCWNCDNSKTIIVWGFILNTSLAALGPLAHRLHCRTACSIQNGQQGAPKWPTGSEEGSIPRLLGAPINFCLISFLKKIGRYFCRRCSESRVWQYVDFVCVCVSEIISRPLIGRNTVTSATSRDLLRRS